MRKSMVATLAVLAMMAAGCLMWAAAELNGQPGGGGGQPGAGGGGAPPGAGVGQPGGAKKGPMGLGGGANAIMPQDADKIFDMYAKGRDFFSISEIRSLQDPLTMYAQIKGISNGQINRAQFREFYAQLTAQLQAPGGAGPGGFGGQQPGGGGFGGQPGGKKSPGFGGVGGTMKPAPAKAVTWEYRVLTRDSLTEIGKENFEAGLNQVGAEGWELIGIETNKANYHTYIFRRPGANRPHADAKPSILDEYELSGVAKTLRAGKLAGTNKPSADAKPVAELAPKQKAEEKPLFRIFRLKHAKADEVAQLLSQLFGRSPNQLRIVADSHGNQLLLRGSAEAQDEVQAILERLDVPADEAPASPGPGKKGGSSLFKKRGPGDGE